MHGLGTIVNVAAIVVGGLVGLLGGRRIPERLQKTLMSAMGVSVLFVGVSGALSQMLRAEGGALTVQGTMMTGEFPRIEDRNVCVTGSLGRGDCGHSCTSVGRSQVLFIEGKPVVRVGDPVTGEIEGRLVTGSDFVFSD